MAVAALFTSSRADLRPDANCDPASHPHVRARLLKEPHWRQHSAMACALAETVPTVPPSPKPNAVPTLIPKAAASVDASCPLAASLSRNAAEDTLPDVPDIPAENDVPAAVPAVEADSASCPSSPWAEVRSSAADEATEPAWLCIPIAVPFP